MTDTKTRIVMLREINVVANFRLDTNIDVDRLIREHPTMFACAHIGAQVDFVFPPTTFMFTPEGKVTGMRGHSQLHASFGAYMLELVLRAHGYTEAKVRRINFNNTTTTIHAGREISFDIASLRRENAAIVTLCRENFPGAAVKPPDSRNRIKVFTSGNNFVVGPRCRASCVSYLKKYMPLVFKYSVPTSSIERNNKKKKKKKTTKSKKKIIVSSIQSS